ncbi:MAG TPA: heavy metal translocating P-type ATPase [Terracidiphilus sp.]|nr:heavy metal translocating P-type ATPase [Terracidiphilus sp.]
MTTSVSETLTLPVLGMTCAACQHHVETALQSTPGVESAHVDLMGHKATVVYDPRLADVGVLVTAIRDAGYDSVLPGQEETNSEPGTQAETRKAFYDSALKAWITIVAGAVAMLLAMPLDAHMGWFDRLIMGRLPWLYTLSPDLLRWTLLVSTAVVMVWAGRPIFSSAWRSLLHGNTNMNTLVSLGTGVAFLYSGWATLQPGGGKQVYFDAVLLILGFLLLGKSLEAGAKRRALAALDSLSKMRPSTARKVLDGMETIVPLEEIRPGDMVKILPGERFPIDAQITDGRTSVDESMITGESTPIVREAGERVLAGSLNYDGAVICRAQSLGEETVLAQMTRMVEQAQSSRTPMEHLADRASSIFVPTVIGLATLTFGLWALASHSLEIALANAVAVLVIACPCAMGLAIPAALTVAVGRGAQMGVLFKGGEAMEQLSAVDTMVLDKTGTLTEGRPALAAVLPLVGYDENELLRVAAAAEEQSNHPIAHAIVDAARARSLSWRPAREVQIVPGRGVTAAVDEYSCMVGNEAFFRELFARTSNSFPPPKPGVTRLFMALQGQLAGCFDVRDALRADAVAAVAHLRVAGLRILMLTGDSAAAAAPIANQAGIHEVEAGLDPAAKLERVEQLQSTKRRVAMVGDGINDAGALAKADVGIAMGSGVDLAQEAGGVVLLRATPTSIVVAYELARKTLKVMRENLAWAAGYNLVGIPIAAGVLYPFFHILLTPWLAAAAMALSSVSVLLNSLRLRRWKPVELKHESPR